MVQSTSIDQADVVFLVEGTAINGAYLNDMKANYIVPTLEYFSQTEEDMGKNTPSVDKSNVMYGVVLYRTAQSMPGTCCTTYGPYSSTQKLLNAIDHMEVELTGGKSESYANLAEGMSVVLSCFEDFSEIRHRMRGSNTTSPSGQGSAQKHCIMICNSAPYSMPVAISGQPFEMKNYEQLAVMFNENNINLSILSPRKIPILFKIFEKAGGDLVNNTKNYCKDPRHLVLLKGYSLKERPISPTVANAISISSPLQNATAPSGNIGAIDSNNSGMSAEQVQQQQQQANMRTNQQDYQFQMNQQNQNIRPNMMGQPNQQQQQPGQPGVGQMGPGNNNNVQGVVGNNVGAPGVNMFNNNNNMMNRPMGPNVARRMPGPGMNPQQQQQQMQGPAQQQNMAQMQQQQQTQPNSSLISQLNVMPQQQGQNPNQNIRMQFMNPQQQQQQGPPQQVAAQQQQQQQGPPQQQQAPTREKIWTGVLEYMDKPNRVTKQISVFAMCAVKDGEAEIKADNWPAKLPMQVIQKQAMTAVIGQFAKESKTVFFHPTSTEGMECFSQGTNAGYIHFKNCNELRVAVLLYLPERKQLIGLIPNNQPAFLERLRKVYSEQQALQQQQMQAQQQQQQQQQPQNQQQGLQQGQNMMEGGSGGVGGVGVGGPGEANLPNNNNQQMMQQQMVNQPQQNDGQFRNQFQMNPQQQQMGNPQMMNDFVPMQQQQQQRMVRPVMANNNNNPNQMQQGNMGNNPQVQQQVPGPDGQFRNQFQMNPQQQQHQQMPNPQMMNDFAPLQQQQQQRMVRPQNNQLRHLLQRQPQFNPGMQGVNPQQAGGIQQQNPNVAQIQQQQQQNFDGFDF